MTSMIILKNRGRQRFLFSLYHELVCRETGQCSCQTALERNDAGRMVPRRYPASVQIDGRSESEPLPAAVLRVPQVRNAVLKNRKLDRVTLSEAEYKAALEKLAVRREKRRKFLVDAKRVEQGLRPLHKVQGKLTKGEERRKKVLESRRAEAQKPAAATAAPKVRTRKSDKE
jgi:hypothetical protein